MVRLLIRLAIFAVVTIAAVVAAAWSLGSKMPVEHMVSESQVINASPAAVFARITDIAHAPSWRHEVKAVTVLESDNGEDRWVEDLGHGMTMTFTAIKTEPLTAVGSARREVMLNDPEASYSGTWIYVVSPGPTAGTTTLSITELGYIHPPLYRFLMNKVLGPLKNIDQYFSDMKAAVAH